MRGTNRLINEGSLWFRNSKSEQLNLLKRSEVERSLVSPCHKGVIVKLRV